MTRKTNQNLTCKTKKKTLVSNRITKLKKPNHKIVSAKRILKLALQANQADKFLPIEEEAETLDEQNYKTDFTKRTIIIAHRGGNFGPDNSMKNFRGAI